MRVGADKQIFVYTRHDLTDDQWAKLEPLLPDRTPIRGGRWMDHRKVINGVLWRTRSGCALAAAGVSALMGGAAGCPGAGSGRGADTIWLPLG